MSNFKRITFDIEGMRLWRREIDADTFISVVYRQYLDDPENLADYETAIVFRHPYHAALPSYEWLVLDGDYMEELDEMPKEQLREWYASKVAEEAQP